MKDCHRLLNRCYGCKFYGSKYNICHYSDGCNNAYVSSLCPIYNKKRDIKFDVDNICEFKVGDKVWFIDSKQVIRHETVKQIQITFPVKFPIDICYFLENTVAYAYEVFSSRELAMSQLFAMHMIEKTDNKKIKGKNYGTENH